MRRAFAILLLAGAALTANNQASHKPSFSIKPGHAGVRPGQTVEFKLSSKDVSITGATWKTSVEVPGAELKPADDGKSATFKAPAAEPAIGYCSQIKVTATVSYRSEGADESAELNAEIRLLPADKECAPGDTTLSIIGFEQAGASSSSSEQRFFFMFYTSRPLTLRKDARYDGAFGPQLQWWSDVRIASYPQQISTPVAQFSLPEQFGRVPVNQLVNFGEFRTGLSWRLTSYAGKLIPNGPYSAQRSSLSVFAGAGALSPLNSPNQSLADRIPVFNIPPPGTPQAAQFAKTFPTDKYDVLSAPGTKYVGLTAPSRDRFYREYGAGVRLTTFWDDEGKAQPPPAMVAVSLGQHELVSGGRFRGVCWKVEAFYPLRVAKPGDRPITAYLFGRAVMRLGSAAQTAPLLLQQPSTNVAATDPSVAIIPQPSNRDVYTIGMGLDVAAMFSKLSSTTAEESSKKQ